jgi:hypothetical protein
MLKRKEKDRFEEFRGVLVGHGGVVWYEQSVWDEHMVEFWSKQEPFGFWVFGSLREGFPCGSSLGYFRCLFVLKISGQICGLSCAEFEGGSFPKVHLFLKIIDSESFFERAVRALLEEIFKRDSSLIVFVYKHSAHDEEDYFLEASSVSSHELSIPSKNWLTSRKESFFKMRRYDFISSFRKEKKE